jgi:hypothetical protein
VSDDMRGHADCPACGQRVIDITYAEMREFGGPHEFADAVTRLMNAHLDACKPTPPDLPPRMRRARTIWQFRVWFILGVFTSLVGWNLATSEHWPEHLYVLGIVITLAVTMLVESHNAYRAGYIRGRFSGQRGQPPISVRYLHPADGVMDPADN